MMLLFNVLVMWCLISIPVSLLVARMIKTRGLMYVPAPVKSSNIVVMKYRL